MTTFLKDVLDQEIKHQYTARLLGGAIGLALCFNFVPLEQDIPFPLLLFALFVGFVFWGIGINLLTYFMSDPIHDFILPEVPKETLYRALVVGHLPLLLAALSANGVEWITARTLFLYGLEAVSVVLSLTLVLRARRQARAKQGDSPSTPAPFHP